MKLNQAKVEIGNNDLKEAFKILEANEMTNLQLNELIHLKNRYAQNENEKRLNVIPFQDYTIERNSVLRGVLQFIEALETGVQQRNIKILLTKSTYSTREFTIIHSNRNYFLKFETQYFVKKILTLNNDVLKSVISLTNYHLHLDFILPLDLENHLPALLEITYNIFTGSIKSFKLTIENHIYYEE